MSKICVVIVTYNSESHIYDCLSSVFKHNDIGDDLEVIVVDNCSRDFKSMEDRIHELYANRVLVISNTTNGGYGQGNNIGIQNSHAPIIMIMNPDVRLIMPVFKNVESLFGSFKQCAVIGMKQIIPGEKGRSFGWSYRSPFWLGVFLYPVCRLLDVYISRYMYFQGSCFFLKKTFFSEVGLFDENVFMYGEEDDIHWRLKRNGYSFYYQKCLCYKHLHEENSGRNYDVSWKIQDFNSKKYLDIRDGFGNEYTKSRLMKQLKSQLFIQRIKSFFGHPNLEYVRFLKEWKLYLSR